MTQRNGNSTTLYSLRQDASAVAKGASIDTEKTDSRRTQDSHGRVTKGVRYHPERYWNVAMVHGNPSSIRRVKGKRANRLSEENPVEIKDRQFPVRLKRNEDYSRGGYTWGECHSPGKTETELFQA